MYRPGSGVGVGKVIAGAVLGLGAIAGFATGIGILGSDLTVKNSKISTLQKDINTNNKITEEININPPNGFIN